MKHKLNWIIIIIIMEDLLLTIIQDANSARLTSLKDTTQVAYGKIRGWLIIFYVESNDDDRMLISFLIRFFLYFCFLCVIYREPIKIKSKCNHMEVSRLSNVFEPKAFLSYMNMTFIFFFYSKDNVQRCRLIDQT